MNAPARPKLRDYTFLGVTQSLCPECLELTPAKIIVRNNRVYFRKTCETHGVREDFICSDATYYDRQDYAVPGKLPVISGIEPDRGCPYDCGLCTEHEQHTCVALVEVTENCNLTCPMCFASSAPGGRHLPLEDCKSAIDRLVQVEGRPEILQLSGGEPTLHPQFEEILAYAAEKPIDYITVNTNGVRLAHDAKLVESFKQYAGRFEVYLQIDGLNDEVCKALRGEALTEIKKQAIQRLGDAGVHITFAVTLQGSVNEDQIGPLVQYAAERPWVTGVNFQPATYSGRHVLPEQLENRVTFPDVIKSLATQTDGMFREDDFMPLPCAHPNCHSLTIAHRHDGMLTPLPRFFDAKGNLDLLANGISFTRERAKTLVQQYLARQACGPDGECDPAETDEVSARFFQQAMDQQLGAVDLFRVTITSFLDAYNFDLRRVMKCCTHHVLPSGHVIPFCAYNVLYREGHVKLPPLVR